MNRSTPKPLDGESAKLAEEIRLAYAKVLAAEAEVTKLNREVMIAELLAQAHRDNRTLS